MNKAMLVYPTLCVILFTIKVSRNNFPRIGPKEFEVHIIDPLRYFSKEKFLRVALKTCDTGSGRCLETSLLNFPFLVTTGLRAFTVEFLLSESSRPSKFTKASHGRYFQIFYSKFPLFTSTNQKFIACSMYSGLCI